MKRFFLAMMRWQPLIGKSQKLNIDTAQIFWYCIGMIHEPKKLTDEQKKEIVAAEVYKRGGGRISCGHDFWNQMKEADYGDTVLCTRCYQYFVKMKDLVWWIDGGGKYNKQPHSNHLDGTWYQPVSMRLQDVNGNEKK